MNERATKAGFHLLLSGIALWEYAQSSTPFRKACTLAWMAFHAHLALDDWRNRDG